MEANADLEWNFRNVKIVVRFAAKTWHPIFDQCDLQYTHGLFNAPEKPYKCCQRQYAVLCIKRGSLSSNSFCVTLGMISLLSSSLS